MSLIDYLRALQSTTGARPGNMSQTITPIGDGQNQGFVMPADGWVSIGGSYQNNEYGAAFIWGDTGKERPTASMSSNNSFGFTAQALGFITKGARVNYNVHGITNYYARIFPVIGGGLSSILQALGGGLWLRLNHFLSRFSLYTRERLNYRLSYPTTFLKQIPSGSGISHSLKQRKLNTKSRAETQLLRHSMVQRVYLWTVRQIPQLKTQEFHQEISTQRHTAQTTSVCDTSAFGFRLSKVQRLGLVLTEVPRRHYGAIQQSARLSFAQGGAL